MFLTPAVHLAESPDHAISRSVRFLPLMMLGALAQVVLAADPALEPAPEGASPPGLEFQTGVVELPNKLARLELAEGYRYLNPADARTLLAEMWGTPGKAEGLLGLVVAPDADLEKTGGWVAILVYSKEGHLSDQDMAGFNTTHYLDYLKDLNTKENEKRKSEGLFTRELVDWTRPPFYWDKRNIFTTSKRFWNEQAKRGQETSHEHEHWVLGRRGKVIVWANSPLGRKTDASATFSSNIAEMIHFNPGHRHEDFDPKSDPRAVLPAAMLMKEAAAEGKSFLSTLAQRKLPLLVLIGVAVLVMKGVNKIREA